MPTIHGIVKWISKGWTSIVSALLNFHHAFFGSNPDFVLPSNPENASNIEAKRVSKNVACA